MCVVIVCLVAGLVSCTRILEVEEGFLRQLINNAVDKEKIDKKQIAMPKEERVIRMADILLKVCVTKKHFSYYKTKEHFSCYKTKEHFSSDKHDKTKEFFSGYKTKEHFSGYELCQDFC